MAFTELLNGRKMELNSVKPLTATFSVDINALRCAAISSLNSALNWDPDQKTGCKI